MQWEKSATLGVSQDQTLIVVEAEESAFAFKGGGATSRNSHGSGWSEEVCYTLNVIDVHGVVYEQENNSTE